MNIFSNQKRFIKVQYLSGQQTGFTIIEIILAVTLSALLLSVIYWTYFSINRSIDSASENQDTLETGRTLSEMIRKDVRCIYPHNFPIIVRNEEIEDYSLGEFEFVTFTRSSKNQIELRRVGYLLKDSGNNKDRILIKRESPDLSNLLGQNSKSFEVSRAVRSFHVELFDGTEWVSRRDVDSTGVVPKQVKVTFEVLDAKGTARKFITDENIKSTY
jgi:prepilin-type N-terminal cleavage/methylation domain-containing protein